MSELSLIRVFDVLFYPNIAYMIITCALFAIGLAGIYTVFRPPRAEQDMRPFLARCALFSAAATLAIRPITNLLPLDFNELAVHPLAQLIYFVGLYLALTLPFFMAGLVTANVFIACARQVQLLYLWDLLGAALGSLVLIPLLPIIGPGGILFCAAALGVLAAGLFSRHPLGSVSLAGGALALILVPLAHVPRYYDFVEHQGKRGVKTAREVGSIERTIWDPISKIDVINYHRMRYIAYDGGSQGSIFYPFDGDFQSLRSNLANELSDQFWQRGVLASHYFKRDTGSKVLVIGSAGGQEIKAALMYGAQQVDAIELVGAVVELGRTQYGEYIGDLFNDPRVHVQVGEGRAFLRASHDRYDIIQIFSNHTSSSIASGTGAMATTYLQTVEAYQEYFWHLTDDGLLHINHYAYPRMITTAAAAWAQLGRTDFQQHVVVVEYEGDETLPTFLVKMQPWSESELLELKALFETPYPAESAAYRLAEDPLHPDRSFLAPAFFTGNLSPALRAAVGFRIEPSTDDRPYFNFLRRRFDPIEADPARYVNEPIASQLNNFIGLGTMRIPMDVAPLVITGFVALLYAGLFILVPLLFSQTGRTAWQGKAPSLLYFSCLGAGFILIEFVLIQTFMKLIGSPLYTYSTVISVLLLGAGLGSYASRHLHITPRNRWHWPFWGVLVTGLLSGTFYPALFNHWLASPELARILVAAVALFPLGFFLGMPFPLGLLALEKCPRGAGAWAWGMNGLMTVTGGLIGIVLSILWGFQLTLLAALGLYGLAFAALSRLRRAGSA